MAVPTRMATATPIDEVLERLTSADRRLRAQEWPAAFDDLLSAWRGLRAGEIAALVDALSQKAARDKKVTKKGDTQIEHVTKWTKMFHERSALGLGVLLADLRHVIVEDQAQPRFIIPRIDALTSVQDDPRIVTTIIPTLRAFGWGGQWSKVLSRCQRALEAARDPRTAAMLRSADPMKVNHERWITRIIDGLAKKKIAEAPPPLPTEVRALVSSIAAAIEAIPDTTVIEIPDREKPREADPAALLEEVRRSPEDDELRLVLADALDAAGDPRGELIVLQIRRANGESNAKTLARERALLKAHKRTWLGAIAPVVKLKSAVFERGFLERCTAVAHRKVDAEVHFQHEEWATVRSITFEDESRITPVMRSLREAININMRGLEQLAERGHPKLERLGLSWGGWGGDGPEALAACPKEKLPRLRQLDFNGYVTSALQLNWIWSAPWSDQLEVVGVTTRALAPFANLLLDHPNLRAVRIDARLGYVVLYERVADNPKRFIFKLRFDEGALSAYARDQLVADLKEVAGASESFDAIVVVSEAASGAIEASSEQLIRDWLRSFKRSIKVNVPFDLPTGDPV